MNENKPPVTPSKRPPMKPASPARISNKSLYTRNEESSNEESDEILDTKVNLDEAGKFVATLKVNKSQLSPRKDPRSPRVERISAEDMESFRTELENFVLQTNKTEKSKL